MSADTLTAFDAWLEERDLLATAKVSAARLEGFGVCLTANKALQSGEAVLAPPPVTPPPPAGCAAGR